MSEIASVVAVEYCLSQELYGWSIGGRFRDGLDVRSLSSESWERTSKIALSARVLGVLVSHRPDCVLVPGYGDLPSLTLAVFGRFIGAKVVLMSETTVNDKPRSSILEWLKGRMLRVLFDAGLVGGTRARSYLMGLGIPSSRIWQGYDCVDNEWFETEVKKYREKHLCDGSRDVSRLYFLHVGRHSAEKNIELLLRAYSAYRKRGGRWGLVQVGKGPMTDDIRELASTLQLGADVQFLGFLNGSDVIPAFASAGALIHPSRREAWGLVINEAMASGLPVIASSVCGAAADLIVEGQNGFSIASEDPGVWAAKMSLISDADLSTWQRFSNVSQLTVGEWSVTRLRESVAAILGATF